MSEDLENKIVDSLILVIAIILGLSFVFKGIRFFLFVVGGILMFLKLLFRSAVLSKILSKFNIYLTEQKLNNVYHKIQNLSLAFSALRVSIFFIKPLNNLLCFFASIFLTPINFLTPLGSYGTKLWLLVFLLAVVFLILKILEKIETLFTKFKNKLNQ